jgi:hypothetical protein
MMLILKMKMLKKRSKELRRQLIQIPKTYKSLILKRLISQTTSRMMKTIQTRMKMNKKIRRGLRRNKLDTTRQ